MIKSIEDNLKLLYELYKKSDSRTNIVFIRGDKGLGKTVLIESFIKHFKNCVTVMANNENEPYLKPFQTAVYNLLNNEDESIFSVSKGLTYNEITADMLLSVMSLKTKILYIKDIERSSLDYVYFLRHIFNMLLKNNNKSVFIVVECNTDSKEYSMKRSEIQELAAVYPFTNFINFKPYSKDEIKTCFLDIFNHSILIDENDLNYIADATFGNIGILYIIISYLRQEEIIVGQKDDCLCKSISAGLLSNILESFISQRYSYLEAHLKRTLQQSSLLGKSFDPCLLQNAFRIPQADEWLIHAESISGLIKHSISVGDQTDYSFENDEVFLFVKRSIPSKHQQKWLDILFKYYTSLFNEDERKPLQTSSQIYNLLELSIKSASYSFNLGKYDESIKYYVYAINYCMQIMNYNQAVTLIASTWKFKFYYTNNKRLMLTLDKYYAECCEYLGYYNKALERYTHCVTEYNNVIYNFDLEWYEYKVAFCTYYTSRVDEAFRLTYKLKNEIENHNRKDNLYCETLSLLSTLYMEKGEMDKSAAAYKNALNSCIDNKFSRERFILQRKADICNYSYISMQLIEESCVYFKDMSDKKEYAKATHNLGADLLYIGNFIESESHLNEALDLFTSFGSIDVLYAYNGLGVLRAIKDNDYIEALRYFELADFYEMNAFKKIAVWINKVICYLKLNDLKNAEILINQCESMDSRRVNSNVSHYSSLLYIAKAIQFKLSNEFEKSLFWFKECLKLNLKREQLYIVSRNIELLSDTLRITIDQQVRDNCNSEHEKTLDDFVRNNVFFTF
jgi:tetratricopeptide (TPR) repeat protein